MPAKERSVESIEKPCRGSAHRRRWTVIVTMSKPRGWSHQPLSGQSIMMNVRHLWGAILGQCNPQAVSPRICAQSDALQALTAPGPNTDARHKVAYIKDSCEDEIDRLVSTTSSFRQRRADVFNILETFPSIHKATWHRDTSEEKALNCSFRVMKLGVVDQQDETGGRPNVSDSGQQDQAPNVSN